MSVLQSGLYEVKDVYETIEHNDIYYGHQTEDGFLELEPEDLELYYPVDFKASRFYIMTREQIVISRANATLVGSYLTKIDCPK